MDQTTLFNYLPCIKSQKYGSRYLTYYVYINMAHIAQYYKYCEEYKKIYGEKTAVLIQVGSFFEIYGEKSGDIYIKSPLSNYIYINI